MKRRIGIAFLAIWGFCIMAVNTAPSYASGPRYWIDESTDFTGNGCQNSDFNNVTSSLKSRPDSDGCSGTRWSNENAWPEDYIEQKFDGIDHVAGDYETLSAYAGHGDRTLIQFGYQRNGRCTVNLDSLLWHFNQQILGYHNSPSVKDDQLRDFYYAAADIIKRL